MNTSSRSRTPKFLIDRAYLFQKLSEPPFQGLDHLQHSHDILRSAASRYLENLKKLKDVRLSSLQEEMLKNLNQREDRPLTLRTLRNHLIEYEKGNAVGSFHEHTYLCIFYAATQLKIEGVLDIDPKRLKHLNETGVGVLSPELADNSAAGNSLKISETEHTGKSTSYLKVPAASFEFYFQSPTLSATMPVSDYPPSLYEKSTVIGKFLIGLFFSSLASLSILLFFFFGTNDGTLTGAFITLSIMNFWTGRFGWYGDFQYHPEFTEIGRRFVHNMYLNSIAPRQSFSFAVYSESILVIVYFILLAFHIS